MKVGPYTPKRISDGTFRLDGGAMYGVVPKVLWERNAPADDKNRILLGLNCLLIAGGDRKILVDTGIGDKFSRKEKEIYGVDQSGGDVLENLRGAGLVPEQITDVVVTHLHFDHGGGLTRKNPDGSVQPTFPAAAHHIQRKNWEWANRPSERDKASYLQENFAVLAARNLLDLVEGEAEVAPGVSVVPTAGHTPGHQMVRVSGDDATAVYCGDLIPTSWHVPLPYIMGYDLSPLQTLEEKRALLDEAIEKGWVLIFEHEADPTRFAGRVARDARGHYHFAEPVALG